MKVKRVTLVIARYREDVSWLKEFDTEYFEIICFNKGGPIYYLPNTIRQITLPNVGRESHTYLHYILSMYDSLTEYVVFLQGCPFDHLRITIEPIRTCSVVPKGNLNVNDLKTKVIEHVNSDTKSVLYFALNKEKMNMFPELHIESYLEKLMIEHKNVTDEIKFVAGSQFVIHRKDILRNTKSFYQEMYDYLSVDHHNKHPPHRPFQVCNLNGYVMERLWGYIFNMF